MFAGMKKSAPPTLFGANGEHRSEVRPEERWKIASAASTKVVYAFFARLS
jgi:hypothetical protein